METNSTTGYQVSLPSRSYASRLWQAFRVIARNRLALIGLVIILTGIFAALFAPYITTHDPSRST